MTDNINASGSQTVTVTEDGTAEPLTLVLRFPAHRRHLQWAADVIDNEGMGKKKSKCCCIYERPKKFDEDSDSSSESDYDVDCCDGSNGQKIYKLRKKQKDMSKIQTDHCRGHTDGCYTKKKDKELQKETKMEEEVDDSNMDDIYDEIDHSDHCGHSH